MFYGVIEGAESDVLPRLRGVMHAYAFFFAVAAAVVLVVTADGGRARVAALVYGAGLCGLFGVSATYHRWRWDPRHKAVLQRLDHSMIFVFIAASYTPIALLVLTTPLRWIVFASVWGGAAGGVVFSLGWIDAPRSWIAGAYVALGWVAVVAAPQLLDHLGLVPAVLLLAGGVLYSVGAVIYARQRPDPWPATFGFHEVFHTLVTAAAMVHFAVMAGWVFGSA
ncbi:MAG: hemolysin family protein [Solirubrobacterales bacterium]|nr:hemolysin family protein [Solirubrobacterales bacterium]